MIFLICGMVAGASIALTIENVSWDEAKILWKIAKIACKQERGRKERLKNRT